MEPLSHPLRGVELFAALPLVAPLVISTSSQSMTPTLNRDRG